MTITIGNSQIITYTRRLDVLPGDVDDNDAVNTTDGVLILRNYTPAHAYQLIFDMNGDGAVDSADFALARARIGSVLPGPATLQAAAGAVGTPSAGLRPLSSTADAVKVMTTGGAASTSPKSGLDASLVDAILAAHEQEGTLTSPSQSLLGMGKKRTLRQAQS